MSSFKLVNTNYQNTQYAIVKTLVDTDLDSDVLDVHFMRLENTLYASFAWDESILSYFSTSEDLIEYFECKNRTLSIMHTKSDIFHINNFFRNMTCVCEQKIIDGSEQMITFFR
jgi:hypothetical protein